VRYEPTRLALDVEAPSDGWLLVTDRWSRSWRATVDGEHAPIWGGDFVFRAVRVHAGANRVEFRFEPPAWRALVVASWGTLLVLVAFSGGAALRRRSGSGRRQVQSPEPEIARRQDGRLP
jgi:uncharacterized membrane protein YfhO